MAAKMGIVPYLYQPERGKKYEPENECTLLRNQLSVVKRNEAWLQTKLEEAERIVKEIDKRSAQDAVDARMNRGFVALMMLWAAITSSALTATALMLFVLYA